MRLTYAVLAVFAVLAVTPAISAAADYRGKGKGAGRLVFSATKNGIKNFVVEKVPVRCESKGRKRSAAGFLKADISSKGKIRGKDTRTVREGGDHVTFDDRLRGSFSDGREKAHGWMRFQNVSEINGKRYRCESKRISWSANRR